MAKYKDLTNNRFGKLIALKVVGNYYKWVVWLCKCDCGKTVEVPSNRLRNGEKKSCGCLKDNYYKNELNNNIKEYQIEGTNVAYLKSKKLSKSNKSGVRGVSQKKNGKWLAQIVFQRKNYNLGTYSNFEDAVKARKEAEKNLFNPVLDKLKKARD